MKRSLLSLVLITACHASPPPPAPALSPSPSPAPAPSSSVAPAPPTPTPPPVSLTRHSYAALCPDHADVSTDSDAGAPARPPTATDLLVDAKLRTSKKDFIASIAVPAKRVDRTVFEMGTEGDPFQCCSRSTADALDVTCMFSGVDVIDARARASVQSGELVIKWCKADLSAGAVMDRGEERVKTSGLHAWFGASTPACAPKLPQ